MQLFDKITLYPSQNKKDSTEHPAGEKTAYGLLVLAGLDWSS